MKKIFIIIMCAMAALILGYGIQRAVLPVQSEPLKMMTYELSAPAKGYILRDESIYYADRDGTLYNNASVGARVAKDSLLYTIYDSSADDSAIQELNVIDSKIKSVSENSAVYSAATGSVEGDISARVKSVIGAARENDVTRISRYRQDINDLRENGEVTNSEAQIEELKAQKERIEASFANTRSEAYALTSGIFTSYNDGFEDKIDINNLDNCTVEYIDGLGEPETTENTGGTVSAGDFVCSVVNNHRWFVLLTTETDEIADLKTGSDISVRFKNIANRVETGKISYISGESQNSDGKSFILVEFTNYFDGAFSYRVADADLVFESYTGYKIPSQAIRTSDDGKYTVPAVKDNKEYVCDVDILYSDTKESYVIVNSAAGAAYDLSVMDRIVTGER